MMGMGFAFIAISFATHALTEGKLADFVAVVLFNTGSMLAFAGYVCHA